MTNAKTRLKDEFKNWYASEFSKRLGAGEDLKIDMRLSVVKPLHGTWVMTIMNNLADGHGLIKSG